MEVFHLGDWEGEMPPYRWSRVPLCGAQACALSPSKAEATGSHRETRVEYRLLPRKSPSLQLRCHRGQEGRGMDGASATGCSDPGDRPMHSDLGLTLVNVLSGLPGAPWAGLKRFHISGLPACFLPPHLLTTKKAGV